MIYFPSCSGSENSSWCSITRHQSPRRSYQEVASNSCSTRGSNSSIAAPHGTFTTIEHRATEDGVPGVLPFKIDALVLPASYFYVRAQPQQRNERQHASAVIFERNCSKLKHCSFEECQTLERNRAHRFSPVTGTRSNSVEPRCDATRRAVGYSA